MKPIQRGDNICSEGTGAAKILLVLMGVTVVLSISPFALSLARSVVASADGLIQETVGEMISAVARYDQERFIALTQRWATVTGQAKQYAGGRAGRLQESLGQAITLTGRAIFDQQVQLRGDVATAEQELNRVKQGRTDRWQEQLGEAVLVAYRRAPEGGPFFRAAYQREVNRRQNVNRREMQRLESQLNRLIAEEADFRRTMPLRYQDAIQSAHRASAMLDEAEHAWTRRILNGLEDQLAWQRRPEDFQGLVATARAILAGPAGVGGFVEYGLPALVGLVVAMAWFGLSVRKESSVAPPKQTTENSPSSRPGNKWSQIVVPSGGHAAQHQATVH